MQGGDTVTSKDCGKFISDLRKEKNLTQKQLAEILNVSDKAISRWETGKGFPDVNSLIALSEFFKVSVNELLTGKIIEEETLSEIADKNVIVAIETKEKAVKKKKLQTILCVIIFSVLLLPPAIPTFIYLVDSIITNASFENISEFIAIMTVAVLLFASGFTINKGYISLLHSYHYKNVVDREGYCKAMGKTLMLMGLPTFISSFSALFPAIEFIEILGTAVLIFGLLLGCAFIFKIQYKYNGGLF